MKRTQRWISLVLCIALVLSVMPTNAFAEQSLLLPNEIFHVSVDEKTETDTVDVASEIDEEAELLSLTETVSGYCGAEGDGTNLTWTLTPDGVLTLEGSGEMKDYFYTEDIPWRHKNQYVKKVVIGENITKLGNWAFYGLRNLERIYIPKNVTALGGAIFTGCTSLTTAGPVGGGYDIEFEWTESIPDYAFNQSKITEFTFPKGVKHIGFRAFASSKLTYIEIPDTVIEIEVQAFYFNHDVKIIVPDSVQTARSAFASAVGLGIKSAGPIGSGCDLEYEWTDRIPDGAFADCNNLSRIVFPKGLTTIPYGLFNNSWGLEEITIPEGVVKIEEFAFAGSQSLKSINLPSTLVSIGIEAFSMTKLKEVYIPSNVKEIGSNAFSSLNSQLTDVCFMGDAPAVYPLSDRRKSFSDKITLFYIEGTSGWTDSEYYDAETGTWNGYKLDTWDGTAPSQLPDEQEEIQVETEPYYRVPENRLFYIHAVGSEHPSGFSIIVDDTTFTSGDSNPYWSDAITVTIPDEYDGYVSIVHENDKYYPFTFSADLTGQTNTITMIPRTITGPFAHALLQAESGDSNRSYSNLLTNVQYFDEVKIQDNAKSNIIQLYPVVNWNGHGEGTVWLEQDSIIIPLEPNQMNDLDWSKCYFTGGKPIYLCVAGEDDTMTRTKTAITVYEKPGADVKLNLGDALTIDTGDAENEKLSILEKQKLEVDYSGDVASVEVSVEGDGTVKGVLGFTFGELSYKESAFASTEKQRFRDVFTETKEVIKRLKDSTQNNDLKGVTEYIDRLKKQGVKPAYAHGSFGAKGDVQIIGYFTGKITNEGLKFSEMGAAVIVSGSVSYTHNTIIAVATVPVPAHFKVALGAKVGAYINAVYDRNSKQFIPTEQFALKGGVSLKGEVGPGWEGYLSGGVEGAGNLKISSVIPIAKEETIFSIQADFSFVGTILGIDGKWTFYETPERVFWNAGDWCWVDPSELSSDLSLLSESVSDTTSSAAFLPDFTRSVMLFSGDNDEIVSGVNGYQAPALAKLSDGSLLAVWVADVESRKAVDKNGIYYSVYRDDAWSNPALVYDDGTNDSMPQVHYDNNKICLAWQNYSNVFGTSKLPDYDTLVNQINTVSMIFDEDEGAWVNLVEEQPEWYLAETDLPEDFAEEWPATTSRRLQLETATMRAVLYTASDSAGTTQVWGLFNDGISWGEPVQLTTSLTAVNCFDAVAENDKVTVIYTSGDRADALLSFCEVYDGIDIAVTEADYLHQTFSPGQTLTLKLSIKNNSIKTANGVTVTIFDGNEEVHQEKVAVRFDSGEEDILHVNYTLPSSIGFNRLGVRVFPNDAADIDDNNNYAECVFCTTDLSVEHVSAIDKGGHTGALVQVVNRGQTITEKTTIAYRKNAPDGELVATQELQSLKVGELVNITTELRDIIAGDLLYVEILQTQEENLIANNSLHTLVSVQESEPSIDSTAIMNAEFSNGTVKTQISCTSNAHNTAMIGAYDASGKMLEVYFINLDSGINDVIKPISVDGTVSIRVFVLNEKHIPVCLPATEINKTGFRADFDEALANLRNIKSDGSLDIYTDASRINEECTDAVLRMYTLDLMTGDGKNFNPQAAVTRAELVRMVYVALNGGLDDEAAAYTDEEMFTNVTTDDWFAGYANYCAVQKLMPIGDGTFWATDPVTTLEAARTLLCMMGYSAEACGYFENGWADIVLTAAKSAGLFEGFDDAAINSGYIERQWLAVMFSNAIGENQQISSDAVFRTYLTTDVESLNFLDNTASNAATPATYTMSQLWRMYPNADGTNYVWIDDLAIGDPIQIDDFNWQIKLREDAVWQNGDPINADTWIFTFQQQLDPKLKNSMATYLYDNVITIVNAENYLMQGAEGYPASVAWEDVGLKKIDDYTIQITTTTSGYTASDIKKHFNSRNNTPIHPETWAACLSADGLETTYGSDLEHFVGCGPYIFDSWEAGSVQVYEKNSDHWLTEYFNYDAVKVRIVSTTSQRLKLFEEGLLDQAAPDANTIERYIDDSCLTSYGSVSVTHIDINCQNPLNPISGNLNYRKAIYHAIDREYAAKHFFGHMQPVGTYINTQAGMLSESALTYRESEYGRAVTELVESWSASGESCGYNPTLAWEYLSKALEECNVSDGTVINLLYAVGESSSEWIALGQYLQEQWATIFKGKITLEIVTYANISATEFKKTGDDKWDLNPNEWARSNSRIYPYTSFYPFRSIYSSRPNNYTNTEFDNQYSYCEELKDGDYEQLLKETQKLEELYLDAVIQVPVYQVINYHLFSDRLQLPVKTYIPGFGWGESYGTIK